MCKNSPGHEFFPLETVLPDKEQLDHLVILAPVVWTTDFKNRQHVSYPWEDYILIWKMGPWRLSSLAFSFTKDLRMCSRKSSILRSKLVSEVCPVSRDVLTDHFLISLFFLFLIRVCLFRCMYQKRINWFICECSLWPRVIFNKNSCHMIWFRTLVSLIIKWIIASYNLSNQKSKISHLLLYSCFLVVLLKSNLNLLVL